ncbi:phage tail protein [Lonepinella sp. MS14436]|uniref:phage tail protein n=1 Tax=Lonepinella sp. MS14436 TaxID=3003619 RepID=UPI0036DAB433
MGGNSGNGSEHTPYEAPDSLRSAQRLRAIGLISLGPIKGTVNKWKTTYFDNTPIQNESGVDDNDEDSFNYKNTEIAYNLGTQDQTPLEGFECSEREVSVGAEVKKEHPLTRSVIDPDVTRIRLTLGVNALFSQNDQGDTNGTSVSFQVLINGKVRGNYTISGKSSSRFYRSYIIGNLPERPFDIQVQRITEDSKSQRLQNATTWVSYTEIIDTQLSYPNMAMVGVKTDSRYNPNFPNMNFLLYGRIIKVPANYDPETRTYEAGIWKGDFKLAWSNNPAWVFYDLITDPLVGLGSRVGDYGLDKFQLYQIAKYCDELVDDGYGGKEPRMTANLWITEQRDAYQVVSDMASVFRAIAVWNGTQFTAIQDRPADPICLYSQANVINGKFTRQYAAQKAIYTAVEVEYADQRNMYQKAIEYVSDDAMIARYGYNVKKMTAYACTSRGQAHRYGKWVLETSRLEQCTITFSVGRQGLMHLPGDIIEVADNSYAGKVLGGRVVAINGKTITLDTEIEISGESYFSYLNAEMQMTKIKIANINKQNNAIITLVSEPTGLAVMDTWVIKSAVVSSQLYRAIGITENEDGSYTITALQHEPQKESIVDGSASFEPVNSTTYTAGLQPVQNAQVSADENGIVLSFTSSTFVGQGLKYQVKLYRDKKLYAVYDDLLEPNLAFTDLPDGDYIAEIRAKNSAGQLSDPTTTSFSINFAISELVTVPKIFAIELNWKNPLYANSKSAIELWVSSDNNFDHARKLVTLAYPTNNYTYAGLGIGDRFWFWARMVNGTTAGKFTESVVGVPSDDTTQLTDYLAGKITKTELGQSLIDSLQADIDSAVGVETKTRQTAINSLTAQIKAESQARITAISAETTNRTKAIQVESAKLTTAIQDEAKTRGTAISTLQNVDAQQAQQISTVTTKADNALTGLQEEKTARIAADNAETTARNALTARLGTAESNIATIQRTVTTNQQSISEVSQNLNAKIDNIQIGGRNLLVDSEFNTFSRFGDVNLTVTKSTVNSRIANRLVSNNSNTRGILASAKNRIMSISKGRQYTLSFYARGNHSLDYLFIIREDGNNSKLNNIKLLSKEEFNFYTLTFSAPFDTDKGSLLVGFTPTAVGDWVEFHSLKIESGNKATDWTPAPEDVDAEISSVNADLTTYKATQAEVDKAQSSQLTTITARLGTAEGKITNTEKAVSDLNSSTATKFDELSANFTKVNANATSINNNLTKAQTELNAKITAEQTARADADKANADKITAITARVGTAESSIANIQSTKASKSEVASIAQQSLQSVWKSDAQSEIDNIRVGGLNLLRNSQQPEWQLWNPSVSHIENNVMKVVSLNANIGVRTPYHTGVNLEDGETYILSFEYRTDLPNLNYTYVLSQQNGNVGGFSTYDVINDNEWHRAVRKITIKGERQNISVLIGSNKPESGSYLEVRKIKLEKGTIATDWTPAPEDVEQSVSILSAKIDSVQTTLSNADTAIGKRIDTVTATVNDNKAQISTVSNAVATVDNKLSATHTIKTQVLSGGRTAIAGIALGATADNKTTESSVIVMADKFGVVKNASDNNVVPMLSVVDNRVAVNGDLIADGTILGRHIKASQTINSPVINGGSLNIGDGRFSVNSAGEVSIRNSKSNVGMIINNNNIVVYDSNGKIRVRLGVW